MIFFKNETLKNSKKLLAKYKYDTNNRLKNISNFPKDLQNTKTLLSSKSQEKEKLCKQRKEGGKTYFLSDRRSRETAAPRTLAGHANSQEQKFQSHNSTFADTQNTQVSGILMPR